MTTQREYLRYAGQCLRLADKTGSADDRDMLLEMADAWTRIGALQYDAAKQSFFDDSKDEPVIQLSRQ